MDLSLSNPFAALEVRKTKKKKHDPERKKKKETAKNEQNLKLEQEIFGTERRQENISWADDDGEWGADPPEEGDASNGRDVHSDLHDSEEEIDLEEHFGVELGPVEDHEEQEDKPREMTTEPTPEELALLEEHRKKYHARPERKVSKKELKKKEMDDLDDLLADLGIDVKDQTGTESSNKKKKKRNKEKGASIGEDAPTAPTEDPTDISEQTQPTDDASSSLTPEEIKTKLEKIKSTKKRSTAKKSVEIAAAEAKARSKGKKGKKDASHYNQAPNH